MLSTQRISQLLQNFRTNASKNWSCLSLFYQYFSKQQLLRAFFFTLLLQRSEKHIVIEDSSDLFPPGLLDKSRCSTDIYCANHPDNNEPDEFKRLYATSLRETIDVKSQEAISRKTALKNYINGNLELLADISPHQLEHMRKYALLLIDLYARSSIVGEHDGVTCMETAFFNIKQELLEQLSSGDRYSIQLVRLDALGHSHQFVILNSQPIKKQPNLFADRLNAYEIIQNLTKKSLLCDGWDKFYGHPDVWAKRFQKSSPYKDVDWKSMITHDFSIPSMRQENFSNKHRRFFKELFVDVLTGKNFSHIESDEKANTADYQNYFSNN